MDHTRTENAAKAPEEKSPRRAAKRIPQIDLIKVIACIMVLIMHTCRKVDATVSSYYVLYYLTRAAIPLFLMTNGYLQLYGKQITWKYAIKKASTILLIGVLYAVIQETVYNLIAVVQGGTFSLASYKNCITWVIQHGSNSTLWYLAAFALLMLLLPFLSRIFERSKLDIAITAGLILACCCINLVEVQSLPERGSFLQERIPQTFRLWNWLTYYFLGGIIKKYSGRIRWKVWVSAAVMILLSAASAWYMNDLLRVRSSVVNAEYLYDSPLIIIWSVSIFIFLLQCRISPKIGSHLMYVSSGGLVVYILHNRMLVPIKKVFMYIGLPDGSLVLVLCTAATAFCIAFAIYWLLKQNAKLRILTQI